MLDALPDDLAPVMAGARAAGFARVIYRAEVDSTNDMALSLALDGEPEGTVVLADGQRLGRGRRGHVWFSPPGVGVYMSAIVRPRGADSAVSIVTLAAGVAVARAVRGVTSLPVELKWPNDLVIGRPWRKLGGVLCEASGAGARIDAVIVGIGVNVRQSAFPREIGQRATSLESELGRPVDRAPVILSLLECLRASIEDLHARDLERIRTAWREFGGHALTSAVVRWRDRETERRGRARDIDADGALVVEADGHLERIVAGEVVWEGLSRE